MNWRIQKDDPIEDCEEAKRLWVIFKEGSVYESLNPEICFVYEDSVGIIDTNDWVAPFTDIDRWQLIPTPWLPPKMTEKECEALKKAIIDSLNHPERVEIVPEPKRPEHFLNAEEIEQVTIQYNSMNKKS